MPRPKAEAPAAPIEHHHWWNGRVINHPLSDDEFSQVYFEYMFVNSPDRSIDLIRQRARGFICTFMAPQMHEALRQYRLAHPIV